MSFVLTSEGIMLNVYNGSSWNSVSSFELYFCKDEKVYVNALPLHANCVNMG